MHSYHFIKKPYFLFPNSEKMVFLKKVALEYDPSCIISKDDISFSRNNDLIIQTENERSSFSKKKIIKKKDNENMTFSVYSVKMVFLFSTNIMLPFFKKAKITFSRKIHLKMTFFVSLEKIVFILDNMVFQILICNNKCALFNL